MKKIGVIYAMEQEGAYLAKLLVKSRIKKTRWAQYRIGKLKNGNQLILVQCGMGKVNAGITTYDLISRFNPDHVINTGCCGGNGENGVNLYDIIISNSSRVWDAYLFGQEAMMGIKNYEAYENLPVPENMSDVVKVGMTLTSDRFTGYEDVQKLKKDYPDALGYDMEYSVIAQICNRFGISSSCFRVVSDVPQKVKDKEAHAKTFAEFWDSKDNRFEDFTKFVLDNLWADEKRSLRTTLKMWMTRYKRRRQMAQKTGELAVGDRAKK